MRIKSKQRGDTIIEVLLSMAVLAVVASAAYATSTRSFHNGIDAKDRDQALSYAQQQIELIKNADSQGKLNVFQSSAPFCINPANPNVRQTIDSHGTCTPPGAGTSSVFSMADKYDSTNKTFTVTITWTSTENRPQQTQIIYKANDSYIP